MNKDKLEDKIINILTGTIFTSGVSGALSEVLTNKYNLDILSDILLKFAIYAPIFIISSYKAYKAIEKYTDHHDKIIDQLKEKLEKSDLEKTLE